MPEVICPVFAPLTTRFWIDSGPCPKVSPTCRAEAGQRRELQVKAETSPSPIWSVRARVQPVNSPLDSHNKNAKLLVPNRMNLALESIGLIAGSRSLPLDFARLARAAGVKRIVAVAAEG